MAGARPAMVWVGVLSLFSNFVVLPLLSLTPWLDVEKVKDLQIGAEALWPIISGTGIVAVARSHDEVPQGRRSMRLIAMRPVDPPPRS